MCTKRALVDEVFRKVLVMKLSATRRLGPFAESTRESRANLGPENDQYHILRWPVESIAVVIHDLFWGILFFNKRWIWWPINPPILGRYYLFQRWIHVFLDMRKPFTRPIIFGNKKAHIEIPKTVHNVLFYFFPTLCIFLFTFVISHVPWLQLVPKRYCFCIKISST